LPVLANTETGWGFLLFDQGTKSQFACNAACPDWLMLVWNDTTSNPWLLSRWNKEEIQRKTHINALELLAIVAVVWTVEKEFFPKPRGCFLWQRQCTAQATSGLQTSPPSPALYTWR